MKLFSEIERQTFDPPGNRIVISSSEVAADRTVEWIMVGVCDVSATSLNASKRTCKPRRLHTSGSANYLWAFKWSRWPVCSWHSVNFSRLFPSPNEQSNYFFSIVFIPNGFIRRLNAFILICSYKEWWGAPIYTMRIITPYICKIIIILKTKNSLHSPRKKYHERE